MESPEPHQLDGAPTADGAGADGRLVRAELAILVAFLLIGIGARLYFFLLKPLWADEIFTIWVARLDLGRLFQALRLDSGPPFHYLLAKLALLPAATPGALDILSRLPSLLSSLAVLALLVNLGGRLGRRDSGWDAAMLYAVSPLAVYYAAEGRAYAWATLLCLLAFERCLALTERPGWGKAVAAGLLMALAFLSHYLTLFVLAGIGGTFALKHRERFKYWLAAGAVAIVLVLPWLPVLLGQPRASMDWEKEETFSSRAGVVFSNVLTGAHQEGAIGIALLALATVILGLALWKRKEVLVEPAGAVLLGFVLLLIGGLVRPEILLPERTAMLFLPFAFLTVATVGRIPSGVLAAVLACLLVVQGRTWTRPLPIQQLAEKLIPAFRDQHALAVAGIWGPEIRYWFERAGLAGRVQLFPAEIERHPGWYSEAHIGDAALAAEASAFLKAAAAPDILVLPIGYRASHALRQAAAGLPSRRIVATPLFEVLEISATGKQEGPLPPAASVH